MGGSMFGQHEAYNSEYTYPSLQERGKAAWELEMEWRG